MGKVVDELIQHLEKHGLEYLISDSLSDIVKNEDLKIDDKVLARNEFLYKESDIVISLGGDGTMLNTAYESRLYHSPMLGVNFGKLGFLAEFDFTNIDQYLSDIKHGNYFIEERMTLEASCEGELDNQLFALNDIVIEKGRWPKMIELKIFVNDEYVSTFSADGVIIATPTGSTGYSLSAGGPIINPPAEALTICPLAPHTLTMRPLVISDKQVIKVEVISPYKSIQVNCDGQRVYDFNSPLKMEIKKSYAPIRLLHSKSFSYFETLRNKLYWGIDVRNN